MELFRKLASLLETLSEWSGRTISWLASILVITVFSYVVMRYFFDDSPQWLAELSWHLFATLFLVGAAYTLRKDRHVRVDLFYSQLSEKGKAWVDLGGTVLFLIPFCSLVVSRSWDYVLRALPRSEAPAGGVVEIWTWLLEQAERSDQPGGLPFRFLIKFMICLGFGLLLVQAVALLLKSLASLFSSQASPSQHIQRTYLRAILVGLALIIMSWVVIFSFGLQGEELALVLFVELFGFIMMGFPVAFTLGGAAVIFGFLFTDSTLFFNFLPSRIYGIMGREVLMAVPLFIYMGIMLEKSGLAERLLETMALLFGRFRGGLALSVVVVGALLAASTGIVGATVVTMGLISLPTMLKRGYKAELATGTIASSGTLGQIIPPSIVLILLSSQLSSASGNSLATVGDLFRGAVAPGFLLVVGYVGYILLRAWLKPEEAPAMPAAEVKAFQQEGMIGRLLKALFLPLLLIVAVLGSIIGGDCFANRGGSGRRPGRHPPHPPGRETFAEHPQRGIQRNQPADLHGLPDLAGSNCFFPGIQGFGRGPLPG
jgi:TRAP-type mannitol/chloroaromatic compound transport system permease small subunit